LLSALVANLGPRAKALTVADAARWGDLIPLAVPCRMPEALPPADAVAGKIVVDAMNPYAADGSVIELGAMTSSEATRKRLPGARLVKALRHPQGAGGWTHHPGDGLHLDQRHLQPGPPAAGIYR
jgi:8-hydroxy-5-deazaflavin:NADPH oxidoreductase